MKFNEDTRVKIPAVIHLMRLGYNYISKKNNNWNKKNNIFYEILIKKLIEINDISKSDAENSYKELSILLENNDLGKSFYNKLTSDNRIKFIDFENIERNSFDIVTELTFSHNEDEFRPDITILVNGLPLAFLEVKKPNNREGILAEHKRIKSRFKNKNFKTFINCFQLLAFSNNMNYDDLMFEKIQGSFYATSSYEMPIFNHFREEEENFFTKKKINITEENEINVLKDNNLLSIKNSPEYITNKSQDSITNKFCSSLFDKDRFCFIIKYGIVYVTKNNSIEKHIMRYPQFFGTKAIQKQLSNNLKEGIIWHTQGSGKTALAYFATKILKNFYKKKNIISKFYFIVDRIDLLKQASKEFKKRGISVNLINSREEFSENIKSIKAVHNDQGIDEINVVNIHKFADDKNVISSNDYNIDIQRIYFLDEVHRSYKPSGSFLANLHQSDLNSIKIGLTGTPLLGEKTSSRKIFGNYIHKYFYNSSISDGYTLRLIREEIENQYKEKLNKILKDIEIQKGNVKKKEVYSHPKFVKPMLDYIVNDFKKSRIVYNDKSIGAMVICDSYEQAEEMNNIFKQNYSNELKAKLILHDEGTKEDRENYIDDFKECKIDFLFVFNMLLTGFDADRLKKIYFGRKIKSHNLLQALTRVNRPYNDFKYGYVVDFANIQEEFEITNQAYFDELKLELGDEVENYKNLFKSENEINIELDDINKKLFKFDTNNFEVFSQQISQINDKKEIQEIVNTLSSAKELYNIIRLTNNTNLIKKIDYEKITELLKESTNRLNLINTKETLSSSTNVKGLLNYALEDFVFSFIKIKEEEMVLADNYRSILQKTRESLSRNFDKLDDKFLKLKLELERIFKEKNLNNITIEDIKDNSKILNSIFEKSEKINLNNNLLKTKYLDDTKYARLHKRLIEKGIFINEEPLLNKTLLDLKDHLDTEIMQNTNILENENYAKKMMLRTIFTVLEKNNTQDLGKTAEQVEMFLSKEYINEFKGDYFQ